MSDHYSTLGIEHSANESEIKRAWARLVRIHTPDQDPEENRRINEAKTVLLDPIARADYDAQLHYGDEIGSLFEEAHEAMAEDDHGRAISVYKEILALHPRSLDARNQLGLALAYHENFTESVKQFTKLLQDAPDSALYNANLGHIYRMWAKQDESHYADAEKWLEKAVELESFNSSHHVSLAKVLTAQSKYAQAEQVLEQAIVADGKTDIDDVDTMMELAFVMLLSDQKHRISEVARRIKSILPDDEESRKYAAFKFLQIAAELVDEHGAYEAASEFTKAAKSITSDLGDAESAIKSIELIASIRPEVMALLSEDSIQPLVVPRFFGMLGLMTIGEDVPQESLDSMIDAAKTWSRMELSAAVVLCQKKYPNTMREFQTKVPQFIELGSYSGQIVRSGAGSSGCGCIVVCLGLVGIVLAVVTPILLMLGHL